MSRGAAILMAAVTAIVGYQIFLPPVVGLANNGDFGKVIGPFSLTGPASDENAWADTRWEFNPKKKYLSGFYTSEHLLMAAAIGVNGVFSKDGSFDLRAMGLVHTAIFLTAFYVLWTLLADSRRAVRMATLGAAIFCFGDVMYVSYLNSFYMDVAAWLFLLLAALFYLRSLRWGRWTDALGFAVCCLMVSTSKSQHAVLGPWLALAAIAAGSGWWRAHRRTALVFAAALCLLSAAWIVWSVPADYPVRGVFTMTFYRMLPQSMNPGETLRELGLDESHRRYIGMHAYSEGAPMDDARFVEDFRRRIGYAGLARYYARHPGHAYLALRRSLDEACRQRPYLGNFDVHTGYPRFQESRAFSFWSGAKRAVLEEKGSRFVSAFLALVGAVGLLLGLQRRTLTAGAITGGFVLIGMAFTALLVASLADAVDVPRHHLIFYVLFDLLVVLLVHLVARWADEQRTGSAEHSVARIHSPVALAM